MTKSVEQQLREAEYKLTVLFATIDGIIRMVRKYDMAFIDDKGETHYTNIGQVMHKDICDYLSKQYERMWRD